VNFHLIPHIPYDQVDVQFCTISPTRFQYVTATEASCYMLQNRKHIIKSGFFVLIIKNGRSAAILYPKRNNNIRKSFDIHSHEFRGQSIEYEGYNRHVL
jgi:hypothetical protein